MKNEIYIETPKLVLSKILRSSIAKTSIVYTFALVLGITSTASFANRFDPPSLKLPVQQFDARIDSNIFNVDFLLAHVINNSRKTVREVGEITNTVEDLLQNTSVFINSNSSGSNANGSSAGSVIIPPGTTADTIIIVNQNEGDSIAIQR